GHRRRAAARSACGRRPPPPSAEARNRSYAGDTRQRLRRPRTGDTGRHAGIRAEGSTSPGHVSPGTCLAKTAGTFELDGDDDLRAGVPVTHPAHRFSDLRELVAFRD